MINQRIKRGAQLQGRQMLRIAEVLEDVEAEVEAEENAAAGGGGGSSAGGGVQPLATVAEAAAAVASSSNGFAWPWQQQQQQQRGEQQQLASSSGRRAAAGSNAAPFGSLSMAAVAGGSGVWLPGPVSQCSMSLDVGRASKAVLNTMARAARRAPCLQVNSGRPRLSRPSPAAAAASGSRSSSRSRQQKS